MRSPEEELLLTWFKIADRETANNFLTTTQKSVKLAEKTKINITDSTIHKLGRALKKHGFLRLKKSGIYVYAVYEKSWDDVEKENRQSDIENPNPENLK